MYSALISCGSSVSRRMFASCSISLYAERICRLKYFTGVGMSPVRISDTSWNIPITAAWSASSFFPKRSLPITHRAWASMPTSSECSERFSLDEFLISAQRSIHFRRAIIAKNACCSICICSVSQLLAIEIVPVRWTSSMPKLLSSSRNSATTSGVLWISIMIDLAETFMIFAPMTLHSSIRDERFCAV